VRWLEEQYRASERRVCGLMSIAVSSFRYEARRSDERLRDRLVELAREKPRYGNRRMALIEPLDKHSHKRRLTTSEQCTVR
jgi:putative transposase